MSYIEQRNISEVLQLHSLEPSLKTIYVEGISDKLLLERFLENEEINDIEVYEINTINFTEIYCDEKETPTELKRNCKNKVIKLAEMLEKETCKVMCLIDRDYDFHTSNIKECRYLHYTDYNSIELYCFNSKCITNLFTRTLRWASPIPSQEILKKLGDILRCIFYMRLVIIQELNDYELVDNSKDLKVGKQYTDIQMDLHSYFLKTISKNKLNHIVAKLESQYKFYLLKSDIDLRQEIKGHDFIHYLFLYIKKKKNNIDLTEDILDRIIWEHIDLKALKKEDLFEEILNF